MVTATQTIDSGTITRQFLNAEWAEMEKFPNKWIFFSSEEDPIIVFPDDPPSTNDCANELEANQVYWFINGIIDANGSPLGFQENASQHLLMYTEQLYTTKLYDENRQLYNIIAEQRQTQTILA